jgi:very-short-patch-repair endonuclease
VAARQHGTVARRQLIALGFTRSEIATLVRDAHLHVLHRNVLAVGHRNLTVKGHWMAAVLAGGPDAVLSHHAAAALWDLRPIPQATLDVTTTARPRPRGVRCHRVRSLDPRDCTRIDGIPVTTLERTLLDYAETSLPRQTIAALEAAQRSERLDMLTLNALIARSPGRHGIKPLTAAIAQLDDEVPWTESRAERRLLEIVRAAGLPQPRCNVLVEGERVDAVWERQRVIVEVDGYGYHRGKRQFGIDRRRDRKLQLAGYQVFRYTYDDLHHRVRTVQAEIREALVGSRPHE